jgi:hypothetical protein
MERTREMAAAGDPREILTVDNHADGQFIYFTLLEENPQASRLPRPGICGRRILPAI